MVDVVLIIALAGMLYLARVKEQETEAQLENAQQEEQDERNFVTSIIDERAEAVQEVVNQYLPGIVCWGDSLTAGAGGNGTTFPKILENRIQNDVFAAYDLEGIAVVISNNISSLDFSVVNMGVGGEDTNTILGRNGAVPFVVAADFTIPADASAAEIQMVSANGKNVSPLRQGNKGMDYVTINGVKGTITIEQETYTSKDYTYFFKRATAGDSVVIKAGTEIVTEGSKTNLNYIPVIFIGQNGGYDDVADLISQQRAMIEHQEGNPVNEDGTARFIIIGLHTGTAEERAEMETAMEAEYGNQYINLREYMSTEAMSDAGLTPTEEDIALMEVGATPESLLSDTVHFTATGYELIGELIYNRMNELGYFDEVRTAIESAMQPLE